MMPHPCLQCGQSGLLAILLRNTVGQFGETGLQTEGRRCRSLRLECEWRRHRRNAFSEMELYGTEENKPFPLHVCHNQKQTKTNLFK